MKYHVTLSGMGCAHCISRVSNAMNTIGADVISIELNSLVIDFGEDTSPVREAIEELGFEVKSIEAE